MTIQRQKQNNSALWLVLGGAFVLRMILAGVTEGYPYDMSCFVAWGEKLLADGPAGFYSGGYFADYPPGYLFVLGFVALVRQIFAMPYEAGMTYVLLAVVPSLCDCAAAALVWHIGREKLPESRLPLLLAAFAAFDPLLLFDTAVWKQIDGAFALPLCCTAWRWPSSPRRCCLGRCWPCVFWRPSCRKKTASARFCAASAVRRWRCSHRWRWACLTLA